MIPIIARGTTGYFSNISTLVGVTGIEQEALASIVRDPRNIGEVQYVQSILEKMSEFAYNTVFPKGVVQFPDNEQVVFLVRHGIVANEGYTGGGSKQAVQTPFIVVGSYLNSETSFDSEGRLTVFEHALLFATDKVFYFDQNGVRIDGDEPDDYAYAYRWKGTGSDNNEDYWNVIFNSKQIISNNNYCTTQLNITVDNVDIEMVYSQTSGSGNPLVQWDHRIFYDDFIGFELISDPGQAFDMSLSAAFVSR